MLGNITLRAKVLMGLAAVCAGYVVFMPDNSQTIEPTRSGGAAAHAEATHGESGAAATPAPHVIRPGSAAAAQIRNATVKDATSRMSDRIVKDTQAASLFSPHSWFVAPPPAPPPPPAAPQAAPPPTAPPLPFVYMGSYRNESGATYFLTSGDRVYDVKIGDTLDNTYTVDGVQSGQLQLTYMPLKIQQTITVGEE